VPARVAVADGRPVRVATDRRGFAGGAVTHCAGPWKTSGDWWLDTSVPSTHPTHLPHATHPTSWDRDEWDVALNDGAVYRVFRDCAADRWFIDAIVD
jgi:protein ImuB